MEKGPLKETIGSSVRWRSKCPRFSRRLDLLLRGGFSHPGGAESEELVKTFTNDLTLSGRLIVSAYFSQENSQNLK